MKKILKIFSLREITRRVTKFLIIFIIIASWIFSGWPSFNLRTFDVLRLRVPPEVQIANADTATTTVEVWASDLNSWAWTSIADTSGASGSEGFDGSDGNPAGSVFNDITGAKNKTNEGYFSKTFTWEALGVPVGATVTQVDGKFDYKHAIETHASVQSIGLMVFDSANSANILNPDADLETSFDPGAPSGSWATRNTDGAKDVDSDQQSSGTTITIRAYMLTNSGNNNGAGSRNAMDNVVLVITYTPASPTTFLGNDTDPGVNPTIAPGAATTTVGTFNLKTSSGSDTVTNATTTLATGTGTTTVAVLLTNSDNTTTYCTAYSPTSDVIGLTGCNLPVTTASTTFNIRIKPLTHSAMPAPPGGTYNITALITAITSSGGNTVSGTDTTSDTVTIDNASPNGATATSGTAGDQKVTLNWTTSNSGDFDTTSGSVILRWAAASAGSEVPAEGKSDYAAGNTIGTATVACVISSAGSTAQSKIDGSGGDTGCTTTALTNGQQYTYVAFQRDTNGNYDTGASIGTFTPAGASLTFTVDTPSVFIGSFTPGTPIASSTVLTANTNNASGYNITVNRASTTPTLFFNSFTVADTPNSNNWTSPSATTTTGPSAIWTDGTTQGLGFRVKQTGTNSGAYHSAWWGSDDTSGNAKYSGISTSTAAQKISHQNVGSGSNENITVNYRIDVPSNQSSGAYISSPVTYTATVNP